MNSERMRVGSKEWINAHYDEHGVLHTPRRDLLLLWNTRGFKEGYTKFKRFLNHLQEKYDERARDINTG